MRRIQFLLLAGLAATAFTACSDDDDVVDCDDPANAEHADCQPVETDCDDPANADHADCVDPVADCLAAYEPADPAEGLCTDEAAAYAAIENITGQATTAALGCGATSTDMEDPAAVDALVACVSCNLAVKNDISPDCSSCVAAVVACAAGNCLSACAADGNSTACVECRAEHGCDDGVEECQGLPADGEDEVDCEDPDNADHADCVTA